MAVMTSTWIRWALLFNLENLLANRAKSAAKMDGAMWIMDLCSEQ